MSNDLISRSALRKAVNDFYDNSFEGIVSSDLIKYAEAVDELIDNAPTIDTTFREVVAYECGQKSVEERPKGEWIEERDKRGHLITRKCPICKAYHDGMINNYCPNCGARMER